MDNVTEPRSPNKCKQSQEDSQTHPKSPGKEKITCKGCDKKFQLLLSHLERTKSCQDFYDMSALRKEAERLTKEKKRQRSYDKYHNDPDESPRKQAYYQERRDPHGTQCPKCGAWLFTAKDTKRHNDHVHSEDNFFTCQICDKRIEYKENLDRHMREVHGGEKYKCEKCPAAYSRKSDLQIHIREDWHYITFYCKQCKKTLVFKNLGGLIRHVIVKRSEGEQEYEGHKWKIYKTGILVTCKSQVESTQLEDGKNQFQIPSMPKKDKVKAAMDRYRKKKEIINEGLKLANNNAEFPKIDFAFEYDKHEDDGGGRYARCKRCDEQVPYSNEHCEDRMPVAMWQLHRK